MILPASCLHISLPGTRGLKVTEFGITGGDGYDVRITCVHRVLMLCSGTFFFEEGKNSGSESHCDLLKMGIYKIQGIIKIKNTNQKIK
jgi:hypothetical protein